jgi:hypothetical protein
MQPATATAPRMTIHASRLSMLHLLDFASVKDRSGRLPARPSPSHPLVAKWFGLRSRRTAAIALARQGPTPSFGPSLAKVTTGADSR